MRGFQYTERKNKNYGEKGKRKKIEDKYYKRERERERERERARTVPCWAILGIFFENSAPFALIMGLV
jgi:hypothetical protein